MNPKYINTENIIALYFFCAKRNMVKLNRFYNYTEYLQYNVGKSWDLTCDKHDLKYVGEEFPNIFSFDGNMIQFNKNRELLKPFLKKLPPEFIEKALELSKQYFIKKPEARYYNYKNDNRTL